MTLHIYLSSVIQFLNYNFQMVNLKGENSILFCTHLLVRILTFSHTFINYLYFFCELFITTLTYFSIRISSLKGN